MRNALRRRAGKRVLAASALYLASAAAAGEWWAPGDGRPLPGEASYANATGALGILNTAGTIDTRGYPFFEPLSSRANEVRVVLRRDGGGAVAEEDRDVFDRDPACQ